MDQDHKKGTIIIIKEIISWVLVVLIGVTAANLLTECIILKAEVPTSSMESTLMPKDRLIGNRMAYLFSEPKRGDVVIFLFPDDETELYVKRIIGLPGEKVDIIDGKIYIDDNTVALEEIYLKEEMRDRDYQFFVPEECYLMLGDNRNMSVDSRGWENTYVSKGKIIAKAWFKYSPNIEFIK